jgi:predicted DNA-binding protein with PD1-like motif
MSVMLNNRVRCHRLMEWTRSNDDLFLVLEPGEEIHASIRALAEELDTQEGPCELVSLQGNLALMEDGSPFTHIHATFADNDNVVHAGHMFEATVEVVAEIHLRILSKAIMTRCPMADSEFVALKFD